MNKVKASLLNEGSDEAATIYRVLEGLVQQQCAFCDGYGHNAMKCSTKKGMDRALRSLQLGGTWGKIKSKVLAESYARMKIDARNSRNLMREAAAAQVHAYERQQAEQAEAARRRQAMQQQRDQAAQESQQRENLRQQAEAAAQYQAQAQAQQAQAQAQQQAQAQAQQQAQAHAQQQAQAHAQPQPQAQARQPQPQQPTSVRNEGIPQNQFFAARNTFSQGFYTVRDDENGIPYNFVREEREPIINETPSRTLFMPQVPRQSIDLNLQERNPPRHYNMGSTDWAKQQHAEALRGRPHTIHKFTQRVNSPKSARPARGERSPNSERLTNLSGKVLSDMPELNRLHLGTNQDPSAFNQTHFGTRQL